MLLMLIVFNCIAIVALLVDARYRIPVMPPLILGMAIVVDRTMSVIKKRSPIRYLLIGAGIILIFLLGMHVMRTNLPRKTFMTGNLPTTVVHRSDNFNGQIRLLGFMPFDTNHRINGYFYLTLYWQLQAHTPNDLEVSVQLLDPKGDRVAWRDATLGSISYPEIGTSRWPLGAILAEAYLIEIPSDAPPVMDIYVNLYEPDGQKRLPVLSLDETASVEDRIRLGRLGLLVEEDTAEFDNIVKDVEYHLGDSLQVTGFNLPSHILLGEDLPVTVCIKAETQLYEDYVVFFHIADATGHLVAQSDSPVLDGDWTTAALIPGYLLSASRLIDLPDDLAPGTYRVTMGIYGFPSLERLLVTNWQNNPLPDSLIEVGQFTLGSGTQ
jgi:hypothetical protein